MAIKIIRAAEPIRVDRAVEGALPKQGVVATSLREHREALMTAMFDAAAHTQAKP